MKKIGFLILILSLVFNPLIHAQKGKNKGGGNKGNVNIKIKDDNVKIKVKDKGKDGNIKLDIKNKGNGHDNGWHNGHNKREKNYGGTTVIWFFGPGDIYNCKGKGKKEKIVVFDGVCVRLGTNISFMFGLLGDMRVKLDAKKGKLKPERYDQLKVEINLLDEELKLIELKKNKIKMRLGKLKG